MRGPFTAAEMAARIEAAPRTVRRWLTDPDKIEEMGWRVETKPAIGGNVQYQIYEIDAEESEAQKAVDLAAADPCLAKIERKNEDRTAREKFELLLHKKLMGKKGAARCSLESYYRNAFSESGKVPKGLLHRDGRRAAGRKGGNPPEVDARFCEMVKAAATSPHHDPAFITQQLRKVTVFHRMLCEEFGADAVDIGALRRAKYRYNLKDYFNMPDYDDTGPGDGEIHYFAPEEVFGLVQMDGCQMHYLECKSDDGKWIKPIVIEFFDTGSRYMFALDCYESESSENSIDIFSKWLSSTAFPKKTIKLRPDKAGGFQNLRRPIHELNLHHSTPNGFFMDFDSPRARNPKAKVHLETSHRRLHNFEAWVIKRLEDKVVGRRKGTRFTPGGRKKELAITRLNITIDELRASEVFQEYKNEHNGRLGKWTVGNERETWRPEDMMGAYLSGLDVIRFKPEDIDQFVKYGFEKTKGTVQKNGRITFRRSEWKVVDGAFSRMASTPVKISEVNGKLILFEDKPDGLAVGEAMPVDAYKKPEFVENRAKARLKENEFELLRSFLENVGMVVNQERLMGLYRDGMDLDTAMNLVRHNEHRYNNPKYGEKGGFIAFNLLISDWMSAGRAAVKPYAEAVN